MEAAATGVLEISAWNQANALRQVTVQRGLDVRDFTLTTFGGSGSLLLCRLIDILGLPRVLVPPNPGNVSAFGLLTVDVRNDYVQTYVAKQDAIELASGPTHPGRVDRPRPIRPCSARDFRPMQRRYRTLGRPALLRPGLRGPGAGTGRPARADALAAGGRPVPPSPPGLYGYDFADDPSQQVEWVNLRVSGIGPIQRPDAGRVPAARPSIAVSGTRQVCFDGVEYLETPLYDRAETQPRRHRNRPGGDRGVRFHRADPSRLHARWWTGSATCW